jgi:hypothetical protein
MSLKTLNTDVCSWSKFMSIFCQFCHYKTLVELGVQCGDTTLMLCEAAKLTEGKVFGYDFFEPIGAYSEGAGIGIDKKYVEDLLSKKYDSSLFKITKIDTNSNEFYNLLKNDTNGKIDFAFIDASHSYSGVRNDFSKVYPLLTEEGSIAIHDTYSHVGLRKFVLDLYQELNDNTFDIINLPYGRGNYRYGLTILTKRSYPLYKSGIIRGGHDPLMSCNDVYQKEQEWYLKQIKKNNE